MFLRIIMRSVVLLLLASLAGGCAGNQHRIGQAAGRPGIAAPAPEPEPPPLPPIPSLAGLTPEEHGAAVVSFALEARALQGLEPLAVAALLPMAAVAHTAFDPAPQDWPERTWVEWTHPNAGAIGHVEWAVRPQGYGWFVSVASRPSVRPIRLGGDFITALRGSWEGCAEVQARAFSTPSIAADGTTVIELSPTSNLIVSGDCMDPPPQPIAVPEPNRGQLMSAGLLGLLGLFARRRADA